MAKKHPFVLLAALGSGDAQVLNDAADFLERGVYHYLVHGNRDLINQALLSAKEHSGSRIAAVRAVALASLEESKLLSELEGGVGQRRLVKRDEDSASQISKTIAASFRNRIEATWLQEREKRRVAAANSAARKKKSLSEAPRVSVSIDVSTSGAMLESAGRVVAAALALIRINPEEFSGELVQFRALLDAAPALIDARKFSWRDEMRSCLESMTAVAGREGELATESFTVMVPLPVPNNLSSVQPPLFAIAHHLAQRDTESFSNFRSILLPLDLLPSAVIEEINEKAIDLVGEAALEEDGEQVTVYREVLVRVLETWDTPSARVID